MEFNRFVNFLLIALMGFISLSEGYKFQVGGKDGWVVKPSENYNHWAERNRFQVNDTLFFKYKKGSDSVLQVTKDDYYSCNIKNPLVSLSEGDSIFIFNHSGPFFFISGNSDHCNNGQKLITVVLAIRSKTPVLPSPPPAATITTPPPESPPPETRKEKSPASGSPSEIYAPAPAPPTSSGSYGFGYSVGMVFVISIWGSVVLF